MVDLRNCLVRTCFFIFAFATLVLQDVIKFHSVIWIFNIFVDPRRHEESVEGCHVENIKNKTYWNAIC